MTIKKYKENIYNNKFQTFFEFIDYQKNNNKNSISVSDIIKYYRIYYNKLTSLIREYNILLKNIINDKKIKLYIIGYEYDKNNLLVALSNGSSSYRLIYNPKISISNDYADKEFSPHLILSIKNILNEVISIYEDYKDFFSLSIIGASINSNIMLKINYHDLEMYLSDGTILKKGINSSKFYSFNDRKDHLKILKNKDEEFFKYIYIDINNCPKWIIKEHSKDNNTKIKKRIFSF